ncbi:hypothetical protein DPEC_G00338170 [Dallia pectoralis]|uniref:Uncharacterized protein n=1 Tax=Dallia pectoralis TaxID=75939 RepID=A0ACC2F4N8_DALPE|nr:hypothetical protein DPEC_G00338170 [Dallia pectoralis]
MNPDQTTLRTKLEELECHFTWDLDGSQYKLLRIREHLEDIGSDMSYPWCGQKYNLWAYIHHTQGANDDALKFLNKAEEAFHLNSPPEHTGPWLLATYGNLAWVYYHLDHQEQSQAYVKKVEELQRDNPSSSPGELNPELLAEKAWTLMKFDQEKKMKATEYFQRAIRMKPDQREWHTSYALALESVKSLRFKPETLDKLRQAKEHDPDNLYLASVYLLKLGSVAREEARQLAQNVLDKPVSCYNGLRPLLSFYRTYLSHNETIDLAEEALERHPNVPYLKKCLADSYKWKIYLKEDSPRRESMIDRAISLYTERIDSFDNSFKVKLDLASIYAASEIDRREHADQIYEELLSSVQEPSMLEMLYYHYAGYLNYSRQDYNGSIDYHMKAAEVSPPKYHGKKSLNVLRKIAKMGRISRCAEIREFLKNFEEQCAN